MVMMTVMVIVIVRVERRRRMLFTAAGVHPNVLRLLTFEELYQLPCIYALQLPQIN